MLEQLLNVVEIIRKLDFRMYKFISIAFLIILCILNHAEASCPKYNRKDYHHWIDADRDCQNTRNEVLIQESNGQVSFKSLKGCKVVAGRWFGSFTGKTYSNPKKLDIDHMVPLKEAHESGAYAWSKSKKRDYANDMSHPEHLIAVASGANRSKGAKDPAEWLPPDKSFWREYALAWTSIKLRWELTADSHEISVLRQLLGSNVVLPEQSPEANCNVRGHTKVKKKQSDPTKISDVSYRCGEKRYCKHMNSCEEAMFHLTQCGRKSLDRDKDGIPCEKICK